jgi:uncharacterized membrane protein
MDAMSRNMVWDGQFHLAMWLITLVGVLMLRAEARTQSGHQPVVVAFLGQLLLGWGIFNVVAACSTITSSVCTTFATCRFMSRPTTGCSWQRAALGASRSG